ncbi:hypothetical protein B6U91_01225 [Candidatus Pacearchaeota archaeon ex4484_71]|nr:MAG: hypothetical protein B6U91_01225 [Candidatus Pacearchaeota archaeon ex4484_71]
MRGEKSKSIEELKHKTRRLSIKEGIFWTFRSAFGDSYLAPFAIAVGSSSPLVAIMNTLWNVSSITQVWGTKLLDKFSRKKILSTTMIINSLGFLILSLIGILYIKEIWTKFIPLLILLDMAILVSAAGIGYPPWFSWMGDVVDQKYRGRWWAKRTTIITFTSVFLTIISSFILQVFKNNGNTILGFILFFFIAFSARMYCRSLIKRHYEPPLKKSKKKNKSLFEFSKQFRKTNFGKFIIFRGFLSISMMITSPLIAIYLLRDLGLSYPVYILITLSGMVFSIFTLNFFGKISDKFGNYRIIALMTFLIPLTPLLWALSTSPIYLFFVPGIIGGISWYAFLLASKNFIYDNVTKEKRAQAIAYINLVIGIGALIGGAISTLLIKFIITSWIEPIILIFLIGSVARMITVAIFVPKMKEIKHKQKFKGLKEFEHLAVKELKPTLVEDLHEIESIKNYMEE